MMPVNKLGLLRFRLPERDLSRSDAFREDTLQNDLGRFAEAPGPLAKLVERGRIRFQKAGEQAILGHWTNLYEAGARVLAAKTEMERRKSDYLQMSREHDVKDAEKAASLAKLQADREEHDLRRDKANYQREHPTEWVEANISESEQKLNEATKRRDLDARWDLHESLRSLNTLIELQRWRRQQRETILKDRSLSPEEQTEDLAFVDELYKQKHGELKVDTRIFEG
jgi:hypothetical protein